jgi:hypothetical protein
MKRVAVLAALLVAASGAQAQWAKVKNPAVWRGGAEAPDLSARAPKARGRKPDLSGVWLPDSQPLPEGTVVVEIELELPRHFINVGADLADGAMPLKPAAAELLEQRLASQGTDDPVAHCKPSGMPIINAAPLPFKIMQTRDLIVMLYEENSVYRQIFLDARKPVEDPEPRYMGYSNGHWEGDELVVDTVGFNDRHWLDAMGHPLTERLHLIERFRRPDAGHLEVEMTVDDPGAYTAPFSYTVTSTLQPDEDLLEYFCAENEKDVQHYQ